MKHSMTFLRTLVTGAAAAALVLSAAGARAAGDGKVDHSAFDALLHKDVANGMVDYDAFDKSAEFKQYLAMLEKVDPASLSDKERLAFWINTYNAYTIQLINTHKERESIRNFNKSLGIAGHGPWREKLVKAGGQVNHLDNVEHDIIRKQLGAGFPSLKEPRIHFALVCAAMGCPPLRSEAYTGEKLDSQLEDQAHVFLLQSPKKNHIDVKASIAYISPVMSKYYREDFGQTDEAIGKSLSKYYPDGPEKAFLASGKAKIQETDYDWTLNSQAKAAAAPAAAKKTP